ncbi:hypothetical protein HPB49_004349 [Dermacentor silvarum]|uniref:Uncharacterized protein n=1 Tax=Dermacentor silvarum TaxID=543639 RepID=A0ACB8DUN5_DERSI|nr:hypothetical protein HPB49_004349 [Dermacentor silvarum]
MTSCWRPALPLTLTAHESALNKSWVAAEHRRRRWTQSRACCLCRRVRSPLGRATGVEGPTAQEFPEGSPLSMGLTLGLAGPRGRISLTPMLKRSAPFGSAPSRMRSGEEEYLEESLLKECHPDDDYVYP